MAPSRSVIVTVDAEASAIVPMTRGRTISIAVIVNVPSACFDWRNRIVSPTLRSAAVADAPPRVIVVSEAIPIVRVQPSGVASETSEPEIAVTEICPNSRP